MSVGGKEFALFRDRRGFTLVELAVALAVVGLLLGLSLIPLRALEERRQIREEMHRLEVVRDAIVGYALRHRTRARTVVFALHDTTLDNFFDLSPVLLGAPMAFRLPGGRPYLPCPDWDGDGYEDRIPAGPDGFTQGIEAKPASTVTATLYLGSGFRLSTGPHWDSPHGSCQVTKGSVPWRTLGVEPSDGWGNRHTYLADPVFASALLGFDRQSIADMYDARAPRAAGRRPSPRRAVVRNGLELESSTDRYGEDCPSVICDGGRAGNCVRETFPNRSNLWGCEWRASPGDVVLKAGAITKHEIFPESFGGKYFPPNGVTEGLPFVLVSHGPNGRFAVNHWATLLDPIGESGATGPICNLAWAEVKPTPIPNIRFFADFSLEDRPLAHEAVNGNRYAPDPARCPRLLGLGEDPIFGELPFTFNLSFFVWEPPGTSDKSGFDDLLLWMTREELSLAIPGDIPRLPQMIVPYFGGN